MRPFHQKLPREPMRVLIRHADAVPPRQPFGPDESRGLTPSGHAQAARLAAGLGGLPVMRVLASPARRCWQTVAPLAEEVGLVVEPCHLLGVGTDPERLVKFLLSDETENAVLCTHREPLLDMFTQLATSGSRFIDGLAPMEPAAVWLLYGGVDRQSRLRYLPGIGRPDRENSAVGRPALAD